MKGTMVRNVELLGTSLKLKAGQSVALTFASNQPKGGWFACPVNGEWGEGNSIRINADDVDIDGGTTQYVYRDGSPFPRNYCANPDHFVTTVSVTIRSNSPLGIQTLRDLIQTRHEVIGLSQKETVCVVRNVKHLD